MRNASKLACRLANNTHAHMAVEGGNLEVVVAEVARELGYSGLKEMQLRVIVELYARVWLRQTSIGHVFRHVRVGIITMYG